MEIERFSVGYPFKGDDPSANADETEAAAIKELYETYGTPMLEGFDATLKAAGPSG